MGAIVKGWLAAARGTLGAFAREARGNVAMMFAISLVPLTIAAGVGLDYARSALLKQQMSDALDAAALAVGSTTGLDQKSAQALAQKYFDANYTGDTSNGKPTVSIGSGGFNANGSVTVNATYNLPTTLLKIMGQNTVPVTVATTVVWGQSKLWVSLVLDNSGSMSQGDRNGTKMDALKNASHQLLGILQNAAANAGDVQVSIVPFDRTVNVGTSHVNDSWIDWTDWEAPPPNVSLGGNVGPGSSCPFTTTNGWGQIQTMSPYGYKCQSNSSNGSSAVSTIPSSGLICPGLDDGDHGNPAHRDRYYNGCWTSTPTTTTTTGNSSTSTVCSTSNSCTTGSYCGGYPRTTTSGNTTTTTTCECHASGWSKPSCTRTSTPVTTTTGAPYTHNWQVNSHTTWGGCIMDRDKTYDYDISNTAPSTTAKGFPAVNPSDCLGSKITPLSYSWSSLGDQIDGMQPNSSTNQAIGVAQGWQTLSDSAPYSPGAVPSNTTRYIILLSDGLNTQDRWWGDGSTENSTEDGYIDAREKATCDAAKADGVIIYTIFLDIGGSHGNSAPLQYCASDSTKYYDLTSTTAVVTAFNQIAQQITNVRVSR